MKAQRPISVVSTLLSLITFAFLSLPGWASIGDIVTSDLAGNWVIVLHGSTGCGYVDMEADVTINSSGAGTGDLITHGGCGTSTLSGQTFTIKTLKTNGSGTAGLSCGTACGWNFDIQVSPDRTKFNLVDVSGANPGNFVEGVAVLQSPLGNIATSDLTGSWQLTLYYQNGCGIGTTVANFTLNSSGQASNVSETYHTVGCGTESVSGYTFNIASLNANGYGTAGLSCGADCGFNFDIQVSPDRSTIGLVDVSDPGNFLAGVAVNNSTAAVISTANLAGNWLFLSYGQGGCGIGSSLVTFTLSVSGSATNATETNHNAGCGNNKTTGYTFTVTSLGADGSGTANLTCGTDCGFNYAIQVSPDRSMITLVDVSDPNNYQIATAVHQ
jgi:hypothetical protein